MRRARTINRIVVFYIFIVMVFAGFLTSLLFFVLKLLGIYPFIFMTPIFSPVVALLLSSAIGTSISALAGERILKPIKQLVKATEVVAAGDFSVRVDETDDNSEVADLLRGFNHMASELGSIEMFRSDFINDFSHEFKTPIVSIRGFAKQLKNEDLSPEKRDEYTDIIIRESERLTEMAANILLLNNLENQQIITDKKEYDLDEQIRNCVILLEKKWSGKNIEMDLNLSEVKIFANEEMLSHLWINLIDNAVKYSEPNGQISIKCEKISQRIIFTIRDQGKGMNEHEAEHIFDKFYQADNSHSVKGNGLGLSIVKRIVELYEGDIVVKSRPGNGTAFVIELPC
ncbi:MAG: HAMP domain-containing sensor histidine kinase [Spirochaetales bacterium]|nr:HAMP domain-containing sensor histidine kinase [Spirochaetales bacterium]